MYTIKMWKMDFHTVFLEISKRKGSERMKKYEVPSLEVIKFDQRDIISASGEEPDETTRPPINLPCFGQSGNQDASC